MVRSEVLSGLVDLCQFYSFKCNITARQARQSGGGGTSDAQHVKEGQCIIMDTNILCLKTLLNDQAQHPMITYPVSILNFTYITCTM